MLHKIYKRYSKSKQFYWWLSSYAAIIVLAILVNMIGYVVTMHVLEKEIEKNNQNMLNNIQIVCDNFCSELLSSAYGLLYSNSVQQISRGKLSDYERQLYAANVLRDMESSILKNPGIENCAVLLRNNDVCIQNTLGITNIDMAYDTYYSGFYDSRENWLNHIFSVFGAEFQSVSTNQNYVTMNDEEQTEKVGNRHVFLVYRIPNMQPQLVVIFKINAWQLRKILTGVQGDGDQTFVVDENGDILFCGTNSMKIGNLQEISGIMDTVHNTEYMINMVQSDVAPFRYVRMMDRNMYLREVKRVRTSFVLGYLLCILVAGALAWLFAELSDRQKRKVDRELQEQRKHMRQNVLKQLLIGQIKDERDIPEKYLDMVTAKHFAVILFDALPLQGEDAAKEETPYRYDILSKYLETRFVGDGADENAYFCVIDEMCAGLLKLTESERDIARIQEKAEQLCLELSEKLHLDMRCAISRVTNSCEYFAEAYEQALEVINLRLLGEDKTVYVYDDALQDYPRYSFNLGLEMQLIDTLMMGDYKSTERIIKQQFDISRRDRKMSLGTLRVVAAEMVCTILKAAAQIDVDGTVDCKQLYLVSIQMNNYQQINEIQNIVLQFAEKLCNISNRTTDKKEKKCANIVAYIHEHYTDAMLNVNRLVDVFGVSRSWLSKNFREEERVSISEYIVKYRLEKAKELLKTDMSVAQIAAAVGFSSEVVFYRAFKKHENITSSQYRQLIQKESTDRQIFETEE